jgi:hypothetical protein
MNGKYDALIAVTTIADTWTQVLAAGAKRDGIPIILGDATYPMYISFDGGTTTHLRIPANGTFASPRTVGLSGGIWVKTITAGQNVTINLMLQNWKDSTWRSA